MDGEEVESLRAEEERARERRTWRSRVVKAAAIAIALGALAWTFGRADFAHVGALLARSGPWIALALVPYAATIAMDALGWRTLAAPIARLPLERLGIVRVRCDALGATLPGGTLAGETLTPSWLRAWMPIESSAAAVAARKCVVGLAESLYVLASFAVGFASLRARGHALPWIVLGAGLALFALFGVMTALFASGGAVNKLHALLARVPHAGMRAWLAARAQSFTSADARLASLFADRRLVVRAMACSFVAWSIESLETWLLLKLVGVELPLVAVFAFEPTVSLLRSVGSFAPAGLGVQDAGYVAALAALGVPGAVDASAAFLLLKRAKELAWTAIGYASMLPARAHRVATPRVLPMVAPAEEG